MKAYYEHLEDCLNDREEFREEQQRQQDEFYQTDRIVTGLVKNLAKSIDATRLSYSLRGILTEGECELPFRYRVSLKNSEDFGDQHLFLAQERQFPVSLRGGLRHNGQLELHSDEVLDYIHAEWIVKKAGYVTTLDAVIATGNPEFRPVYYYISGKLQCEDEEISFGYRTPISTFPDQNKKILEKGKKQKVVLEGNLARYDFMTPEKCSILK